MKEYFLCQVNNNFANLFDDDNLKSLYELYLRSKEDIYYQKQFKTFLRNVDKESIKEIIDQKFKVRDDYKQEGDFYYLKNFITQNYEILDLKKNYMVIRTDYEVSPFLNTLSKNFPDLILIDINKYKIARLGLVI
ncbi:TPA: sporulation inhibitor of replication protein SirA [bacterium]|nr:sporulation inhibitor of replication protein SirA [bacterium]